MSGVDIKGEEIRKGAAETIKAYIQDNGGIYPKECDEIVTRIANMGGTPLLVSKNHQVLGVIYLKDIIKHGVSESSLICGKWGLKRL